MTPQIGAQVRVGVQVKVSVNVRLRVEDAGTLKESFDKRVMTALTRPSISTEQGEVQSLGLPYCEVDSLGLHM